MFAKQNYALCKRYMNKKVRITTVDGQKIEGKIVKLDRNKVYIQMQRKTGRNKATVSFFPFILPLVLFDLLVIVLLDSRRRIF
ncbi:hypothetical protein ACFQ88_00995 [Paenibacillus sp. NPDC056579]|uniref:hypothetical protein n=1 Tax=unclassified Paenibacillus TaxID=185978 RepID=UPI001EF978C8|nr:hypothetical protein [Paenibacillus sp. H1-7]ULL15641.1 hypothetical protein DVH26_15015 [Paenibacillus sp. H1-7]